MHPYIKHLLEDIKNAEKGDDESVGYPKPTTFEEEMQEVERYVSGEGEQAISKFTGLKKEDFPPSEQLTEDDMEKVLMAYDQMLATWNTQIEWQENMPVKARYDFLLRVVLNSKSTPMNFGTTHLDFCTGYAPGCDWKEYCYCKKFWEEEDKDDKKA